MAGTTVWITSETRASLRHLQEALGTRSVDATIRRLIGQPVPDARALFASHREAIQRILRERRLRRLVAFGSRARGDATLTSDLDLAVEAGPGADPLAVLAAEADLEAELGITVNLVELPNRKLKGVVEREGVPFGG